MRLCKNYTGETLGIHCICRKIGCIFFSLLCGDQSAAWVTIFALIDPQNDSCQLAVFVAWVKFSVWLTFCSNSCVLTKTHVNWLHLMHGPNVLHG